MGVKGLWQLIGSTGRPITLESLEGKILAVDVSIWLNQLARGMRDSLGDLMSNGLLIGLFHRICKLLFYRIKPIFIFDGKVPLLKKRTTELRRIRKKTASKRTEQARQKLLKNFLRAQAVKTVLGEEVEGTVPMQSDKTKQTSAAASSSTATLSPAIASTSSAAIPSTSGRAPDMYQLPSMPQSSSLEEDAPAIDLWEERMELRESIYSQFQDVQQVDIHSDSFKSLPLELQHEIMTEMRLARKKSSWATIHQLPKDSQEFSNYQLKKLIHQGQITQRLDVVSKELNSQASGHVALQLGQYSQSAEARRVVSEDTQHYLFIKGLKSHRYPSGGSSPAPDEGSRLDQVVSAESEAAEDSGAAAPTTASGIAASQSPAGQSAVAKGGDGTAGLVAQAVTDFFGHSGGWAEMTEEVSSSTTADSEGVLVESDSVPVESDGVPAVFRPVHTFHPLSGGPGREESPDRSSATRTTPTPTTTAASGGGPARFGSKASPQVERRPDQREPSAQPTAATNTSSSTIVESGVSPLAGFRPATPHQVEEGRPDREKQPASIPAPSDLGQDALTEVHLERAPLTDTRRAVTGEEKDPAESNQLVIAGPSGNTQALVVPAPEKLPSPVAESSAESGSEDADFIEVPEGSVVSSVGEDSGVTAGADVLLLPMENASQNDDRVAITAATVGQDQEGSVPGESSEELVDEEADPWEGYDMQNLGEVQTVLEREQRSLEAEKHQQERSAVNLTDSMYKDAQELLGLFGLPYLVSPGEAEAQCAFLELAGLSQGTVTQDSDIWLFGGKTAYKNFFDQSKYLEEYRSQQIEKEFFLDREKLINLALLLGSDYTEGILGIGGVTAMELLLEFPGQGLQPLVDFKSWWESAQKEVRVPKESKVKTRLRDVSLPGPFPDSAVFDAYMNPLLETSKEAFQWGKPDLHSLRQYVESRFGWNQAKADQVLIPVIKNLNIKKSQPNISSFFPSNLSFEPKVKSKRIQRVLNRFQNPDDNTIGKATKKNLRKRHKSESRDVCTQQINKKVINTALADDKDHKNTRKKRTFAKSKYFDKNSESDEDYTPTLPKQRKSSSNVEPGKKRVSARNANKLTDSLKLSESSNED